ncbi:hypothetical protein AB0L75_21755 [Streptomyces sp. NPDC052101]|uniref:hypothetical protein n=1 Tax=Streptomyces sp. NPDC052101 TaxID=3155763 RepID=UPI003446E9B6
MLVGGFAYLLLADYGPEYSSYDGTCGACRCPLIGPPPTNNVCGDHHLRQTRARS